MGLFRICYPKSFPDSYIWEQNARNSCCTLTADETEERETICVRSIAHNILRFSVLDLIAETYNKYAMYTVYTEVLPEYVQEHGTVLAYT